MEVPARCPDYSSDAFRKVKSLADSNPPSFEPRRRSSGVTGIETWAASGWSLTVSAPRRSRPSRHDERQSIACRMAPRSHKADRPCGLADATSRPPTHRRDEVAHMPVGDGVRKLLGAR